MPGGKTYSLYIILMSQERKDRMRRVGASRATEQTIKEDIVGNEDAVKSLLDMEMSGHSGTASQTLSEMLDSPDLYDSWTQSIELEQLFNSHTRDLRSRQVSI
jgi:hypothetical protein